MKASGAVVLLAGILLASLLAASVPCGSAFPYSDADKGSAAVGAKNCCRSCVCTKSIPPQCRCTDVGTSCYSGCKTCLCTRSFPPQCRCADIKPYCPRPCTHGSP